MSPLSRETTLGEWVARQPGAARVFEKRRLDYCCRGGRTLAEACSAQGLDVAAVQAELEAAEPNAEPPPDWAGASLTALCDHLERTHHAFLKAELPRLTELAAKVAQAHADRHPELRAVRVALAELVAELEPHLMKEERILFPAVRRMEQAGGPLAFPFGSVANPIRMMEHEHENAGGGLAQLRELTGGFRPPDDGCASYRALYAGLQELELDLHQHIHKENNLLFPRAQTLEAALGAPPAGGGLTVRSPA